MVGDLVNISVSGALGNVYLVRKFPVLFRSDLVSKFRVISIADIYEKNRLKSRESIDDLFNDIKNRRIKEKEFSETVEASLEELKRALLEGRINYFQLDKDNPVLPEGFFDGIGERGIVDISAPNKHHYSLAEQVLKRNINLLLEKPAVKSYGETDGLEGILSNLNLNGNKLIDAEHYSHYGNVRHYINEFENYVVEYGKVMGMDLYIREDEDFSSGRNQETIEIEKSGGGMWLDTGIHITAFLRNIGARINYESISAQGYKSLDEHIQDCKYGETRMDAELDLLPNDKFSNNCHVKISVGKSFSNKDKRKCFIVYYERGKIEIDIIKKELREYEKFSDLYKLRGDPKKFPEDAFYNVFYYLYESITQNKSPLTSLTKAIENVRDVFRIYDKASPIMRLDYSIIGV